MRITNGAIGVVLVCQTNLNNWIPKRLANMKTAEVLADYVRTAEGKAVELRASILQMPAAAPRALVLPLPQRKSPY